MSAPNILCSMMLVGLPAASPEKPQSWREAPEANVVTEVNEHAVLPDEIVIAGLGTSVINRKDRLNKPVLPKRSEKFYY